MSKGIPFSFQIFLIWFYDLIKNQCFRIVPSNFLVVAAEHSLGTVSGEEEIRGLATIVANTAYDPDTNLHDIAILKVHQTNILLMVFS